MINKKSSLCANCPHSAVPKTIKEKYNNFVNKLFIECPIENEKEIVGCFIKNIKIDWKIFNDWLKENNI